MLVGKSSLLRGLIVALALVSFQCSEEKEEASGELQSTLRLSSNAAMQGKLTIQTSSARLTELKYTGTPPSQDVETYIQTLNGTEEAMPLTGPDADPITISAIKSRYEPFIATLTFHSDDYAVKFDAANLPDLTDYMLNGKPALTMLGTFDNRGKKTKVLVAIADLTTLNIAAKQYDSPEIEVGDVNKAEIFFNPMVWFEGITTEAIESAARVTYNNEEVVFIHRQFNSTLHKRIQDNIEDLPAATFFKFTKLE